MYSEVNENVVFLSKWLEMGRMQLVRIWSGSNEAMINLRISIRHCVDCGVGAIFSGRQTYAS